MGMGSVNNLRKELCPDKPFPQIVEEARKSTFEGYVDANDASFLSPESMVKAFDRWFAEQGEKPVCECDYFNCAFRSLAYSYKQAIEELENNLGVQYDTIYIVGGGAKNGNLNELTQRVCGKNVAALPIETTAHGNLKLQMER